jgi:hypothetical protein
MSYNNSEEVQSRTPLNNKNSKGLSNIRNTKINTPCNNFKDKSNDNKLSMINQNNDITESNQESNQNIQQSNYPLIKDKYRFSVDHIQEDNIDEYDERDFYYNLNKNCDHDKELINEEVEFNGFAPLNLNFEERDNYINENEEDDDYVKKAKEYLKINEFIYISNYEIENNEKLFRDSKLHFSSIEF